MKSKVVSRHLFTSLVVVLMLAEAGQVNAATVFVSTSGDDAHDGSNWAAAKRTVQAGLSSAASGDQVWVAAGTYLNPIVLPSGVELYGGFAGTETDLAQRDWVTHVTILDGQYGGSVVTAQAGFQVGTIDGFTICNGVGSNDRGTVYNYTDCGGGIYCASGSLTIRNNTITGNAAAWGGGIFCDGIATIIDHNTIKSNWLNYRWGDAGGIFCRSENAIISNNTIERNQTSEQSMAGGLYSSGRGATIVNNRIIGNLSARAWMGGGIYCAGDGTTIDHNLLEGNSPSGVLLGAYPATVTNNTIAGSNTGITTVGYHQGYGPSMIANNTITGNLAGIDWMYDDAIIVNNVITSGVAGIGVEHSAPLIANNMIAENTGPGIDCDYMSSPAIISNTIVKNSRGNASTDYPAIGWEADCSPTIIGNIVAFNALGLVGQGTPSLRYNCVYGNVGPNYSGVTDPTGTDGNISADPKLADVDRGNMHIQPESPCKDAGDDSVVQTGWVDIDGQPRIQGEHVDIGADESDGTLWPVYPLLVIRVSNQGDDLNDGSTWALAKRTVQAGLNAASALRGEVWVRGGTYLERLTVPVRAQLYGGFAGTETVRQDRNWEAHPTILDGQQGGHVVTMSPGLTGSVRIDGFTIQNGHPGGIFCGGTGPSLTIVNCRIVRNVDSGIDSLSTSMTVVNNTISANGAYGIYSGAYKGIIANNTVVGTGNTYAGIKLTNASGFPVLGNIVARSGGITTYSGALRNNCVYGGAAPAGTDGNISVDPRFVRMPNPGLDQQWGTLDDDVGDLRLQPTSPCIDAGENAAVPADLLFDLSGRNRFVDTPSTPDTGSGTSPIVDMGAYEYQPTGRADFNDDGLVDAVDLKILEPCGTGPAVLYNSGSFPVSAGCALWPGADGKILADFDGDEDVDQLDFGAFQRCYSGQEPADPDCGL